MHVVASIITSLDVFTLTYIQLIHFSNEPAISMDAKVTCKDHTAEMRRLLHYWNCAILHQTISNVSRYKLTFTAVY